MEKPDETHSAHLEVTRRIREYGGCGLSADVTVADLGGDIILLQRGSHRLIYHRGARFSQVMDYLDVRSFLKSCAFSCKDFCALRSAI